MQHSHKKIKLITMILKKFVHENWALKMTPELFGKNTGGFYLVHNLTPLDEFLATRNI